MYHFFKSDFFNFEVIRILGTAPAGGADIAECLEAISQIKNEDPSSWHRAWLAQAERAEVIADDCSRNGHRDLARNAYLRASNYFRASAYMFNDRPQSPDARPLATAEKVGSLFRKAMALFDHEVRPIDIPYEGGYTLPGYLYMPPREKRRPSVSQGQVAKTKIPVLINSGGADSIQEELYYMLPAAGSELGYAVITFEGPGQGIVLRREGLYMRPDWEVVIRRVLDRVLALAADEPSLELDTDRIAISGASMGGYFALRGASDPRIKACVAIDPFYDMWDFATAHVSSTFMGAWTAGWIGDGMVDRAINLMCRLSFAMKWEVSLAGWFFGVATPTQTLKAMQKYTLRPGSSKNGEPEQGGFLDRVKCPVLVSGAAYSIYFDVEQNTMAIYDKLKHLGNSRRELWIPEALGDGGLQAKMGALALCNEKTYAFLDKHFGIQR